MRVLVDTNIWIDYLRQTEPVLVDLLERDQVCVHQSVITELALGNLRDRAIFLKLMIVHAVGYRGVRHLLEERRLWGRGLSAVDAALLASVVVTLGSCCGRAISVCVRLCASWACWLTLSKSCRLRRNSGRVARERGPALLLGAWKWRYGECRLSPGGRVWPGRRIAGTYGRASQGGNNAGICSRRR